MKRIAIISLLAVFLITNYAYATITTKEVVKKIEQAQCGELTQEEVEELFMEGIGSLDWENLAQIRPNASACQIYAVLAYLSLIAYPLSPSLASWNIVVNTLLYLLLCRPPSKPQFAAINPNQGEQESILFDVEIAGVNTSFQDFGPVNIFFSPPDGLTISNVNVISNNELEFDLRIAADTPPGIKSVTVKYGFPVKSITANNAFLILERTN